MIEVEYMTAAFDLAIARPRRHDHRRARCCGRGNCTRRRFDPPIDETFALITRRGAHLSPGTRAFMAMVEEALT